MYSQIYITRTIDCGTLLNTALGLNLKGNKTGRTNFSASHVVIVVLVSHVVVVINFVVAL